MDRKTLIFKINRLYDVLCLRERDEAFEYLEARAPDNVLMELYNLLQKVFDTRTPV